MLQIRTELSSDEPVAVLPSHITDAVPSSLPLFTQKAIVQFSGKLAGDSISTLFVPAIKLSAFPDFPSTTTGPLIVPLYKEPSAQTFSTTFPSILSKL